MDEETLKQIALQLRKPEGDAGIKTGKKMNEGNVHINRNTIKVLDIQAQDRILEIGMGNGFFVKEIVSGREDVRYTGCDFSETMVAEAIHLNRDLVESGQVSFVVGAAEKLPFANDTFTRAFTVNTAYFWDEERLVLDEIKRVLRPNGELFIAIRPKEIMQHYSFVKYGFRMYTSEELQALLKENGYQIVKTYTFDEPDQEFGTTRVKVASLIVRAKK